MHYPSNPSEARSRNVHRLVSVHHSRRTTSTSLIGYSLVSTQSRSRLRPTHLFIIPRLAHMAPLLNLPCLSQNLLFQMPHAKCCGRLRRVTAHERHASSASFEIFSALSDIPREMANVSQGEENAPTAPFPCTPDYRAARCLHCAARNYPPLSSELSE